MPCLPVICCVLKSQLRIGLPPVCVSKNHNRVLAYQLNVVSENHNCVLAYQLNVVSENHNCVQAYLLFVVTKNHKKHFVCS